MSHYELMVILSLKSDDKKLGQVKDAIIEMIKKLDGNLTGEQNEYKRKLAYPIGHEKFGVYKLMEFDIESKAIKNLESNMRLMPEVLRFLVIQKKLKNFMNKLIIILDIILCFLELYVHPLILLKL